MDQRMEFYRSWNGPPMSLMALALFFIVVGVGSYLQALTGFALGIFVLGGVIAFKVSDLPTATAVINIMMICNAAIALQGSWRQVNRQLFFQTIAGVAPGVMIGLWLLEKLSTRHSEMLQVLLSILIVIAGIMLFVRPTPRSTCSGVRSFVTAGILGGVFGGLFSIPGPPVVYHYYRQPISIEALRTTLLAIFGGVAVVRFGLVGFQGGLTPEVLRLGALSVPIVAGMTWLYVRFPPSISDLAVRRGAFMLLMMMGLFIGFTAVLPMIL